MQSDIWDSGLEVVLLGLEVMLELILEQALNNNLLKFQSLKQHRPVIWFFIIPAEVFVVN